MTNRPGPLIAIAGHEDKEGRRVILKDIARPLGGGRLVVATVASHQPEGYFDAYREAFAAMGVDDLVELYLHDRAEASSAEFEAMFDGAAGVFFTGGDQLRITSQVGDTPIERLVRDLHRRGGLIAGTSAGASALSETMLVAGASDETHRIGDLHMAPGLGLIDDVIIDQHFAQRGRIGRLLGAVAHNPRVLGIGLDEDTAIVVEDEGFKVIGAGGVYVVDGTGVSRSNVAEAKSQRSLSMFDVRIHVLTAGDSFDLKERRPAARVEAE
jgi:cyanophycinase